MSFKDFVFPHKITNTFVMATVISTGVLLYGGTEDLTEKNYGRAATHFMLAALVGMIGSNSRRAQSLADTNMSLRTENHQLRHTVLAYQLREAAESMFTGHRSGPDVEQGDVIEGEGLIREVPDTAAKAGPGPAVV